MMSRRLDNQVGDKDAQIRGWIQKGRDMVRTFPNEP